MQNNQKIIAIFGAGGFLGKHLIRELTKLDYRIKVATRNPFLKGYLKPLGSPGQIELFKTNIFNPNDLRNILENCDLVINLVGILYESKNQKFNEKEPFYASVYKKNFLKSGESVKINKATLGIELEVCYKIKKSFFSSKKSITMKNISKYILYMAPCIEVVGYRQRKKGITSFGDLCSDFGANVKFLIGRLKKYKKIDIGNLKTNITNIKTSQRVTGNTNAVYINPLNSLRFVLNKIKKDKIDLNDNFYVFTGSTVGVVKIKKGLYIGKIDKLGIVKAKIL